MLVVIVGAALVALAQRIGRRAGMRRTIPWRPIFQLLEHRTRCLDQDRTQVERELGEMLGIPLWAWRELGSPGRPAARRAGGTPNAR
jgi:hypothetical protein